MKRIGVLTGGGDCPGLNAVVRGIVITAVSKGIEVFGFRRGWEGLMDGGDYVTLEYDDVEDIADLGGTILRTSRANPFSKEAGPRQILDNLTRLKCEALIVIGGYDILNATARLVREHGLKVVCIPKSIQNNVKCTDVTFGFLSSANYATEAIDRLHTTARSYGRCLVIEMTGQHEGWAALYAGLAGAAHCILIPEVPYNVNDVCALVERRRKQGKEYTLIVMAEGARPDNPKTYKIKTELDEYGNELAIGASEWLAEKILKKTMIDTRNVVLSSILRGGTPTIFDRMLGLKYGASAVELAAAGKFGTMVSIHAMDIHPIQLEEAVKERHRVPLDLFQKMLLYVK